MGEGRLEPSLTTDGGPYAAGGWNEGCHGVAWRAPADGRCLGVGGSRGDAPHPDRERPTEPIRRGGRQRALAGLAKARRPRDGHRAPHEYHHCREHGRGRLSCAETSRSSYKGARTRLHSTAPPHSSTRLWGEGGGRVRSRASQRQGGLATSTVHPTSTTTAESTLRDAYHALKPVVAPTGPPAHVYVPPLNLTAPRACGEGGGRRPRKGKAASRRPPCTPRAPPLPRARWGTLIMR